MFAWSQLNFSAIPVSISAVSVRSRQTWPNINSKKRLQRIQNVQEGKRHQEKRHLAAFGENFPIAEFLMISAETSCSEIEKNSQMFHEDFHLQLYLPLMANDLRVYSLQDENDRLVTLIR
jgi:hypothetical protein